MNKGIYFSSISLSGAAGGVAFVILITLLVAVNSAS